MKSGIASLIVLLCLGFTSQTKPAWTTAELTAANTAKDVMYMDSVEREIVKYINLARLYPKRFAIIEVEGGLYAGSADGASLNKELKSITPRKALLPDSLLTDLATCLQQEQEKTGATGHVRKACKDEGFLAENCSYGQSNAKSIVMQLLVDEGVPSHGHRWNILSQDYTKIGVAKGAHKKYFDSAVIDFR